MADPQIEAIRAEMARARQAQQDGNEGMARVCARGAAARAVSLRYPDQFDPDDTLSPSVLLGWFRDRSGAPPSLRKAAQRLTVRMGEHDELQHDDDPLGDARLLLSALAPEALG